MIITIAELTKIRNTRFTNQESLYYTFVSIRDSHQEQIQSPFYDIIVQVVVDKNRRYITRACSQFPGRVSCQHLTRKSSNALVTGIIDNRAAFSSRIRGRAEAWCAIVKRGKILRTRKRVSRTQSRAHLSIVASLPR